MAEETKAEESISASGNTVVALTQPELVALTKDMQAVLLKHSAEMGVTSTINLMKVVKSTDEATATEEKVEDEGEKKADSETAKGS